MSKLFGNSIIYTVLTFIEKGMGFFLMPVFTAYISPHEYGSFNLVLSITAFLSLFYTFSLENALGKFYYDYKDDKGKLILGTVFFTILLSSVFFTIIVYVSFFFLSKYIDIDDLLYRNLLLGFACIAFYPVFSVFRLIYRVKQEAAKYSVLNLCYSFVLILAKVVVVVFLSMQSTGLLSATLLVNLLFCFGSIFYFYRSNGISFSYPLLREMLNYSVPLLPHSLSGVINSTCDRLFIGYYLTLTSVGVYSVALQVSSIMNIVVSSFSMAYGPWFFEQIKVKTGRESIANIANVGVSCFCVVGLSLAVFSKEIIMLMASNEYYEAYNYTAILVFVHVFNGVYIFTAGPLLINSTRKYASVSIFTSLLNIPLNYILIPIYGVYGAAYATLIQMFIGVALYTYFGFKSEDKVKFNFGLLFLLPIIAFVLSMASLFLIEGGGMLVNMSVKSLVVIVFTLLVVKTTPGFHDKIKELYERKALKL